MGRTGPASTGSKEVGLPVVPRKFIGIVMIGTTFTLTGAATEYKKLFKLERARSYSFVLGTTTESLTRPETAHSYDKNPQ